MNKKYIKHRDAHLREEYYCAEHECGLKIYVFPKRMRQKTVLLGTGFGSFYESGATVDGERREYPSGIAHYLEHLMFLDENGDDVTEKLAALGADVNAYTSNSRTVYSFSCIDDVILPLHELLSFVSNPHFTAENVERERPVIEQEINMCLDNPYEALSLASLRALYGDGKLSEDVLGSAESIAEITPELLEKCYGDFYRYSNMALAVCGNVDLDRIYDEVTRVLGAENTRGEPPILPTLDYSEKPNSHRITVRMPVNTTILAMNFKDPPPPTSPAARIRREALINAVNELIFSRSGELYSRLLEAGDANDTFTYGYDINRDAAFNSVWIESDNTEKILGKIKKYLADLPKRETDERRLEICKRTLKSEFIRLFDSVDDIASLTLGAALDGVSVFEYKYALDELTPEMIRNCIAESFSEEVLATVTVENIKTE